MQKKAIIIGAGIAGIACAIRLAVQGYTVQIYEKNGYPGGKLSLIEKDGFTFDAGPSLFTQPENIEELFLVADEPIQDYFSYTQVPVSCKYFYENGKVVSAYSDLQMFAGEMQEQLGEYPDAITHYLKKSEKLYSDIGTVFLNHSLHKAETWLNKRVLKALQTVRPAYLFKSLHQYNESNFQSCEAVQLFDRYATYNGSNPYKAPAMLSLIPHLEHTQGTFYPAGGMISITNALYQLALKKGVTFLFNSPVQKIIEQHKKIKGVIVGGQSVEADIVVSNVDVFFTYKNLLNKEKKAKHVLKQERSSSAFIFYWGIQKSFPQLQLHNIFFSKDYQAEFDHIFNKAKLYHDPTIYINITSKMDSNHAPAGAENWFVMINVPADKGQNWKLLQQEAKGFIIAKLRNILHIDIEPLIQVEATLDPTGIEEQTASYQGALYGTSSNSKMAAFLRHPNFSKETKGLFFCGGSVHPGGGIPLCLKSAKIVSELIAQDNKN